MQHIDKTPLAIPQSTRAVREESTGPALSVLDAPDRDAIGRSHSFVHKLVVGREADNDVQLVVRDPIMSRRHFALTASRSKLTVCDLRSTNGVRVRGVKVTGDYECDLGDVLSAGDSVFLLETLPLESADAADPLLFGRSTAMQALRDEIERLATTQLPVLIVGETGTGKDMIARSLYTRSGARGTFVTVDCATATDLDGAAQAAGGGVLFLDEVADLTLERQAKLLRVLASAASTPVPSLRVLSATNVDLHARITSGHFRRDLYGRLSGYVLHAPPLRERGSDIALLLHAFLRAETRQVPRLSARAWMELLAHDWPMNVRELKHVAQRLALAGAERIDAPLPQLIRPSDVADGTRPSKATLSSMLQEHHGSVKTVAALLKRDRKQIYRWLKHYALEPETFRTDTEPEA